MASIRRGILTGSLLEGPRVRVVDTLVLYRGLIDFRTLCERSVPKETQFLVLDLDNTLHFGRNLGELLGWELGAHEAFGEQFLERANAKRGPGRFLFDWSRPLCVGRYVARGARLWAYPGLFYLFAGKLGMRSDHVRSWLYQHFGCDPVGAVQSVPRDALMHHLSDVPIETLRKLTRAIWRRYEADQVINRDDIAWLRKRCPNIHIIVSSASPQPVLEVAAEELDVDEIYYSEVEEHDGYLSAPYSLNRLFLLLRPPRRISPPSRSHVNAGEGKMERLIQRHPEFLDNDAQTVGITDTSYGEDHAWAEYFRIVVDINSPTPFSPIVSARSPLREIHSAHVLTRAERDASSSNGKRRGTSGFPTKYAEHRIFAPELESKLENVLTNINKLSRRYDQEAARLHDVRTDIEQRISKSVALIERDVIDFNASNGPKRRLALRRLRSHLRQTRSLKRRLIQVERPLSGIMWSLTRLLETSRQSIDAAETP